jgi:hypothetical protein
MTSTYHLNRESSGLKERGHLAYDSAVRPVGTGNGLPETYIDGIWRSEMSFACGARKKGEGTHQSLIALFWRSWLFLLEVADCGLADANASRVADEDRVHGSLQFDTVDVEFARDAG